MEQPNNVPSPASRSAAPPFPVKESLSVIVSALLPILARWLLSLLAHETPPTPGNTNPPT